MVYFVHEDDSGTMPTEDQLIIQEVDKNESKLNVKCTAIAWMKPLYY